MIVYTHSVYNISLLLYRTTFLIILDEAVPERML